MKYDNNKSLTENAMAGADITDPNDPTEYEYKVVEEWGIMSYVDVETQETIYVEGECHLQSYWVVTYDPEEKELMEWIKTFSTEEEAQEYKKKLEDQEQ